MERSTIEETQDRAGGRTTVGDAVGTTDVAVNHYRLEPGEGFPSGLHAHFDQEEVFVVLGGKARFEFLPAPPGDASDADGRELTVRAGEVIRFAPGEFQTGRNPRDAAEDLVALALGAPKPTDDVRIPAECPTCVESTLRLGTEGEAFTFDCPACDTQYEPAPCERCDTHALGMALDTAGTPVSRCDNCGHEHGTPPMEQIQD